MNEARKAGRPEPVFFVHPDDIVIEEGKEPRFIGPVGPEAQAAVRDAAAFRDLLLLQAALEYKLFPDEHARPIRERRITAGVCARLINNRLPQRFQRSDAEIDAQQIDHILRPRRQLLKELTAGWRARGVHAPRGMTLPGIGLILDVFEKVRGIDVEAALKTARGRAADAPQTASGTYRRAAPFRPDRQV
jgi:hypothetical protein